MQTLALEYIRKFGLSVFPVSLSSKTPMVAWKQYQTRLASTDEVAAWHDCNLGIATGELSGLVVVDCDTLDAAEWFAGQFCTVSVSTKRGKHFWFQHPGGRVMNATKTRRKADKHKYDVRGDGGYVMAPGSVFDGGRYEFDGEFSGVQNLPVFDVALRPETSPSLADRRAVTDGMAYIQRIHAVSGSGGHGDTWRAVNRLKDAGMDESQALAAIVEWNETNAEPPWTTKELLHKVRSAYRG